MVALRKNNQLLFCIRGIVFGIWTILYLLRDWKASANLLADTCGGDMIDVDVVRDILILTV